MAGAVEEPDCSLKAGKGMSEGTGPGRAFPGGALFPEQTSPGSTSNELHRGTVLTYHRDPNRGVIEYGITFATLNCWYILLQVYIYHLHVILKYLFEYVFFLELNGG